MNAGLRTLATAAGIAAAVAGMSGAQAQAPTSQPAAQPNGYTWGELALLPEYCRDVQGILYGDAYNNTSPRAAYWVSLIGPGFWAMHHYCRALHMVRKAADPTLTRNRKGYFLEKAKDDYIYTIQHVPRDMPLLPEVLLKYGEALLMQDDLINAKEAFDQAREIKPDYWPAYTRWIDVQIGLKQFGQARALAQEGLKYSPDNAELKQRLATLDRRGAAPDAPGTKRVASSKAAADAASAAVGTTPR